MFTFVFLYMKNILTKNKKTVHTNFITEMEVKLWKKKIKELIVQ